MSMTKNRMYLMIAASLLAFTGVANAANVVCPAASAIKQVETTGGQADDEYVASTGGHHWEGSVSYYDDNKVELKKLSFVSAGIMTAKDEKTSAMTNVVVCNYHGDGNADLRLATPTPKPAVPAESAAWSKDSAPVCKSSDVTKCEVKES